MRQQVAEYLAIGRAMRRDQELPGMDRLRGRIAAALGDEVQPESEDRTIVGSSFMTPASGIAVAATVAAVALVGLSQLTAPGDTGLPDDVVAIDLPAIYTEPSPDLILQNAPSERELDLLRRHSDSDILYRMATFEVSEDLEEIEPDGHLVTAEEAADGDQDDSSSQDIAGSE